MSAPAAQFRLPERALLIGFCAAAAGACLDFQFLSLEWNLADAHLHLGVAFVIAFIAGERAADVKRRAWLTAGLAAATLAAAFAMAAAAAREPMGEVAKEVFTARSLLLWIAALWISSPILLDRASALYPRELHLAVVALAALGVFLFASAAASLDPDSSLKDFHSERALMFALVFAWFRAAPGRPELASGVARFVVRLLAVLIVVGALVWGVYLIFGSNVREWLAQRHFLFEEPDYATNPGPRVRLIFPMQHFNRTGYFGALAIFIFILAGMSSERPRMKRILAALSALAFFVVLASFTRGMALAAAAGLFAWAALRSWKLALALLAAGAVGFFLLPAEQRNHFATILNPATYRPGAGTMTSMKDRMLSWEFGVKTAREHPLSGLGYGTDIVRDEYKDYAMKHGPPELTHQIGWGNQTQHLHNTWLEIAAESGLPALAAFLALSFLRWTMLARAFLAGDSRARDRVAAWIALEVAILVAGIVFYMLRRNFGLFTWFIWAFAFTEFARARGEAAAPSPEPAP